MVAPLQERMEEWKRSVVNLDRDHAKGIAFIKVSLPAVFADLLILNSLLSFWFEEETWSQAFMLDMR